eukprot:jgi/Ulvmu1/11352/UM075_0012.1
MSRRSQRKYPHPLLNPNNGITFRLLPGLVIGALLHKWFTSTAPPAGATTGTTAASRSIATDKPAPEEEFKMVLCVNQELKMTKGKIAAQCGHAAVGVVQKFRRRLPSWFKAWEQGGQAKIALRVDNTQQLLALANAAQQAELPWFVIADAGRTEIAAGSKTVVAIGPAPKSAVDTITGKLSLL